HAIEISLPAQKEKCQEISDVLQTIAYLYEKACNVENKTLKANQAEILCLYNYFKEFYYQVKEIMRADWIGEKKAKGIIYNFIIKQIPGTKRENLYKKTYRAKKIHELFEKIGVDKIKYIKTYSANSISELTNDKIQTIIDYFSKNPNTELSDGRDEFIDDSSDVLTEAEVCEETLLETEVSITTTPFIKSYHNSNSEDIVNENNEFLETVTIIDSFSDSSESSDGDGGESSDDDSNNDETNSKDSTKVNTPAHNRIYFRNRMTEQYPDLFWEGGNRNNDYYRIIDESLCPLCKSDHYEDKAKLELPSILSNKTRFRFYNRYKKKTGLDPWINSETSESKQDASNHLSQDCIIKISKFLEEKNVFKYTDSEAKCLVCKDVHTHLGIWGDWSCLGKNDHYFLNCPFRIDQKKVIIAVQSLSKTQGRVPNKISNSPIHSNKTRFYQYAIEHGMDFEKFSVITEAEKNRWAMGCFRGDLERDIRFHRGGIERKEDPRKYHKFLTNRERLVGEELLRCSILKSGLSTAWLDDLMEEWKKIHAQFTQISFEEKTLFVPQ
ncbi:16927_t:CDS:2, partial [Cetraspora pellucida]